MYRTQYRLLRKLGLRQKNITRNDLDFCQEKRFFFIHVPKTAGKSLRVALYGAADGARHCTAIDIKRRYPREWYDFFTFCVVRNPYDRLYSAYRYLIGGGNQQKDDLQFLVKKLLDVQDFESFVCDWLTDDKAYSYTHFIPQYEFIYEGNQCLVDYICRFECLAIDYEFLRGKLDLGSDLVHTNSSGFKVGVHFLDVYTAEMMKKVARIYADDFRLFGYSTECLERVYYDLPSI